MYVFIPKKNGLIISLFQGTLLEVVVESSELLDSFSELACDLTSFMWYDKLKICSGPT